MVNILERDYYSIGNVCEYLEVNLDDLIHYGETGKLPFYVKILGKPINILMQAFDNSNEGLNALDMGESNLIDEIEEREIYAGLASLRPRDIMKIIYTGDIQFAVLEILDVGLDCVGEFMSKHNSGDIDFEFIYSLDKIEDDNIENIFIKTTDIQYLENKLQVAQAHSQASNLSMFDEVESKYPPELDYAIKAWQAVSSKEGKGKPKARIKKWLDENTNLSNEAKNRISIVANWDKTGGATRIE